MPREDTFTNTVGDAARYEAERASQLDMSSPTPNEYWEDRR